MSGIGGIGNIGGAVGLGAIGGATNFSSAPVSAPVADGSSPSTVVSLGNSTPSSSSGIGLYNSMQTLENGYSLNIISEKTGLGVMVVDNFIKQLLADGADAKELNNSMIILLLLELIKNQQINTLMNM